MARNREEVPALFLEFDHVRPIVDANRTEFTEDVLAEEAVDMFNAKDVRKFIQVHDGNAVPVPAMLAELEVHADRNGIAGDAWPTKSAMNAIQRIVRAVNPGAYDRSDRAGVQQKGQ